MLQGENGGPALRLVRAAEPYGEKRIRPPRLRIPLARDQYSTLHFSTASNINHIPVGQRGTRRDKGVQIAGLKMVAPLNV